VQLDAGAVPFGDSVIPSTARNLAVILGKRKPFLETEIKLPVRDRRQVAKQLAQLGFKVIKPREPVDIQRPPAPRATVCE
jgi:hypothetical protein